MEVEYKIELSGGGYTILTKYGVFGTWNRATFISYIDDEGKPFIADGVKTLKEAQYWLEDIKNNFEKPEVTVISQGTFHVNT